MAQVASARDDDEKYRKQIPSGMGREAFANATMMAIPFSLVPEVRQLIADHEAKKTS